MALFELKESQLQELKSEIAALTQAVNDLSTNIGKGQAIQNTAIQSGLTALIAAITGADVAEIQSRIDAVASTINQTATEQQDALDKFNQPKES